MRKQYILILTISALGLVTICIIMIGAWGIFPRAMSKTIAPQEQMSPAELSAAIEAQREASAKLTRSASFDQRIQKLIEKARKKGTVSVIIKVRAAFQPEGYIASAAERLAQRSVIAEAQDQVLSWLSYVPSTLKRYEYIPYIAASVDETSLEQLQSSAEVLDVSYDNSMRLAMSESLPRIGAPRAWAGNFTGAGKTIAVLDSGVDKNHPWLTGKVVSEACYSTTNEEGYNSLCPGNGEPSTAPDSGAPCAVPGLGGVENCGHGTHIAGIAAGRGGVAYDAKIISIKVVSRVDDSVECRNQAPCLLSKSSDMISALLHIYNNLRSVYDIAAVNISLTASDVSDLFSDHCDGVKPEMTDVINQLKSVGIATVIASGNDDSPDAISFPACISSAISVGSVGDGSGDTPADTVARNSNSASFLSLLAPGRIITSSAAGGGVAGGSGTSQAAAHVSGAIALLRQELPIGANNTVWFDDALPAGAVPYPDDTTAGA